MPALSRDLEKTLQKALTVAGGRGEQEATLVHLALALTEDVFIGELLQACAVNPEPLRIRLRLMVGPTLDRHHICAAKPSDAFNRTTQRAVMIAQAARRDRLGSPQIFLALLDESDEALSTVLTDAGVARIDVIRYVSHGLRKNRRDDDLAVPGNASDICVVKLFNDDYTPMEFVVSVLQDTFDHARDDAVRLMLDVHRAGTVNCGTYTRSVAATKVAAVARLAREHSHPLHCAMEPEEV